MPKPMRYEIVVTGHGTNLLTTVLDGFEVVDSEPGETRLVGWVPDQGALHARLERLRDLNIELRDVHRMDDD